MYRVGTGSVCQAGLQSAWGTPVVPDTLINMTGESIKTTVEKGDEGNLLASKTRNQADVMSVKVDGSVSSILRPEFADWVLEAALGGKNDNVNATHGTALSITGLGGGTISDLAGNAYPGSVSQSFSGATAVANYNFDSATSTLWLNWGPFNKNNKWGNDVNASAVRTDRKSVV